MTATNHCPTCTCEDDPDTFVAMLLTGGPAQHARYGWYVALSPNDDGVWAQLIVYAEEDTRESAVARAQYLLTHCPKLEAYSDRYPIPTTTGSLTSKGSDIQIQRKPEGIA